MVECVHNCTCPLFAWLDLMEKKWNLRIVKELYKQTLGFNEIKKKIPGITQGVLSQRLDELQKNKIIQRKVVKHKPLTVEYSLAENIRRSLSCWKPLQAEELKIRELKVKC